MAQEVSLIENPRACVLKIKSDGTETLGNSGLVLFIGIVVFLVFNFVGLILLAIVLSSISSEETVNIDKQSHRLNLKKVTSVFGSKVSENTLACHLGEVDLFAEETTGEATTLTMRLPNPDNKDYFLKFTLNLNQTQQRKIYEALHNIFQSENYRARQNITRQTNPQIAGEAVPTPQRQPSQPNVYAPNITISGDELIYKRTLVTNNDYWAMYWQFVSAVALIVFGIALGVFVVFPLIKNKVVVLYPPIGLVAVGLIFKGIHTILFKLIATKTAQIVHFNKMAQVVTVEDKFITSSPTRKYLFEQVELKLEKQQIVDGDFLEVGHAVTLVLDNTGGNPRRVELMKTRQEYQAIALYNTIAEVLDRPRLEPVGE